MSVAILNWSQAFNASSAVCGGKGWNLARLHHDGFIIPAGGVVSAELYRTVVTSAAMSTLVAQISALPTEELLAGENSVLHALRQTLIESPLPEAFRRELTTFLEQQQLLYSAVAVRSSATQEDSASASFAGIHDSCLNIYGQTAIEQAIGRCFASLWSTRAIVYRRKMENNGDTRQTQKPKSN